MEGARGRAAAILALFAFAFALQGARGLWDPDEGRYVNVALRMVRSGDWLTPTLWHDVPHFSKPPLTYWAVGGSIALFGRNEWAARLPNALAWAFTVLLVHRLARRLAPGRETLAATIQATSLFPFVAANIVTTDTLLALFSTLGVAGFVEHRFDPDRPRRPLAWMGLGFGLAFLTKGPPGLLPLLAILACTIRFDGLRGLARLYSTRAVFYFALVGLGWFALEIVLRPDLLPYLLGEEVVERVATDAFGRNAGLAGLARAFLPVIVAASLPWSPWAIARWLRRRGSATRPLPLDPAAALLRAWLLLPLVVFCLSSSRMPLYLLPLVVPASIMLARALPADALASRRRRGLVAAWLGLLLALKGAAAVWPTARDGRRLAARLASHLPYPPGELILVHRRPPYSLSFYFDVDVERVELESIPARPREPSYRPLFVPLREEIEEGERATIWLVPKRIEEVFLGELHELGWHVHPAGELDELGIFVQPERGPEDAVLPPP